MKKILIFVSMLFFISGCGKYSEEDVVNDFAKMVNNSNGYHLTGKLEIYRDEELYTYTVDSAYQSDNNFRVSLINQTNNHEQIILKNADGVYVITPALNKSFKFQSEWPYNNSQIYLLQPIVQDLQNDKERTFEETEDGYLLSVKVVYDNDTNLEKQNIYLDKELNLTKVEVLNKNGEVKMCFTITEYDMKSSFDEDYFSLGDNYQNENNQEIKPEKNNKSENDYESETTSSSIDEVVYPMYVPVNTYLSNQDNVTTEDGERVILTFSGETPFLLVQETASTNSTTDFVYGDPYLILDTVGAVTDYSVSWVSNGVEYSVVSDTMAIDELITVAESINVVTVGK